jgi:hypothetical protein
MKTISISQWVAVVNPFVRGVSEAALPARGVDAASMRLRADELIPALSAVRELKRTEVRALAISANPKGIVSFSPGLRGTSCPGCVCKTDHNPDGVEDSSYPQTQGSSATLGYVTESLWDSRMDRGCVRSTSRSTRNLAARCGWSVGHNRAPLFEVRGVHAASAFSVSRSQRLVAA